jgi:SPP1 gp7 family putative phage head morphogenesis protein
MLRVPKAPIAQYKSDLLMVVKKWEDTARKMLDKNLDRWISALRSDSDVDDMEDDLDKLETSLIGSVSGLVPVMAGVAWKKLNRVYESQFKTLVKKETGETIKNSPLDKKKRKSMFKLNNVNAMKKLASDVSADVFQVILDGLRSGKKKATILTSIFGYTVSSVFKKARNRARLIARDQSEKEYGEQNRATQLAFGIKEYRWQTSNDERVRFNHASLNGKICNWNNSSVYKDTKKENWKQRTSSMYVGIPGEDYNCRCVGIPIFPSLLK